MWKVLKLDWNLLFTLINLIVFYLLMKKFLFGPVIRIMDERKKHIEDGLNQAKNSQAEALELKQKYEAALVNARAESEQIMAGAKENAKMEYDGILKEADETAAQTMARAQQNIELEKEKTIRDLKAQVAELALNAAKKVTAANTTVSDDLNLYDQFLKEAGEMDGADGK